MQNSNKRACLHPRLLCPWEYIIHCALSEFAFFCHHFERGAKNTVFILESSLNLNFGSIKFDFLNSLNQQLLKTEVDTQQNVLLEALRKY